MGSKDKEPEIAREVAIWAGIDISPHYIRDHKICRDGEVICWNPLVSLDDAHLLLDECKRRGLLNAVVDAMGAAANPPWRTAPCHWVLHGLLATPEQITRAVRAVARSDEINAGIAKPEKEC